MSEARTGMTAIAPPALAEKSNREGRSARGCDRMFEAELLRGMEAAMIEKTEKLSIMPIDFRSDLLDAKRHQIDEQLRQQRTPNALIAIIRIDADRVHHGCGLEASELAKIYARHDETDRSAIALGDQRNAYIRLMQCFRELALEIGRTVTSRDTTIYCNQRMQVAVDH